MCLYSRKITLAKIKKESITVQKEIARHLIKTRRKSDILRLRLKTGKSVGFISILSWWLILTYSACASARAARGN